MIIDAHVNRKTSIEYKHLYVITYNEDDYHNNKNIDI